MNGYPTREQNIPILWPARDTVREGECDPCTRCSASIEMSLPRISRVDLRSQEGQRRPD